MKKRKYTKSAKWKAAREKRYPTVNKPKFKVGDHVYKSDTALKRWIVSKVVHGYHNGVGEVSYWYNLDAFKDGVIVDNAIAKEVQLTHVHIQLPPIVKMTEIERLNKLVEVLQNERDVAMKSMEVSRKQEQFLEQKLIDTQKSNMKLRAIVDAYIVGRI